MNLKQYFQAESLRSNAVLLLFFYLTSFAALIVGYKLPYKPNHFNILMILHIFWGIFFIYVYGLKSKLETTILAWLVFFVFFPKQEMQRTGTEALFNMGISHNLFDISQYAIMEPFLVAAVTISFFRNQRRQLLNSLDLFEKLIIGALLVIIFKNIIQLTWLTDKKMGAPTLQSVFDLLTFVYAIILIALSQLFSNKSLREKILKLFFVLGLFLSAEYIFGKLDIIPIIAKYSFNYRNGFKSVLMANDLMAGLFLITATCSAAYFYFSKNKLRYLFAFFTFNFLMIETFNRSHWMPFAIAFCFICLLHARIKLLVTYLFVVSYILIPTSKISSTIAPSLLQSNTRWLLNLDEGELQSPLGSKTHLFIKGHHHVYSKKLGQFNTESIKDRQAAFFRSIDVILNYPILGVGASNAVYYMSNNLVPTTFDTRYFDPESLKFYNRLKSGEHTTNAHNLFLHLLSEHGLFSLSFLLIFIVYFCKTVYVRITQDKKEISVNCLLAAPIAFIGYYIFQASPVWSILLFLLCFTLWKKESVPSNISH